MTTLNRDAARAARRRRASGARTDVTGFGLLGHLFKLARASGVTAVVDAAAVPLLDGRAGRRWPRLHLRRHPAQPRLGAPAHRPVAVSTRTRLLLLADAQTSGGLLRGRRAARAPVIGEFVPRGEHVVVVR